MDVTLYKFAKRANSTKRPSGGQTFSCYLKEKTDLHSPTIALRGAPSDVNYMSIGNEYYWINARVAMPDNWIEFSGVPDPMATYADQIKATTAFIERSASGTPSLVDGLAPALTNETMHAFTSKISFFEEIPANGTYFVRVANMPQVLALNHVQLQNLYAAVSGDGVWEALKEYLIDMSSLVTGVSFVPINQGSVSSGSASLKIAFYDTGFSGPTVAPQTLQGQAQFNLTEAAGTASTGSSAYLRATLFLPFAGTLTISPDDLRGTQGNITVKYSVDPLSGSIFYTVCSGTDVIATAGGNCMLSVPFGSSTVNVGSLASAAANIGVGAATLIATGNVTGAANSVLSAVGSGSFASSGGVGSAGGSLAGLNFLNIELTVFVRTPPEALTRKSAVVGLPTFQTMSLGSLSGFVKCICASVECDGSIDEINTINGYLNSGAFIE